MTPLQKTAVARYPFENKCDLAVELFDFQKSKKYTFLIVKGFCWDGATIPRVFWRFIGSKTSPEFLIPSMVHDILCENHHYVDNDRYFADKVFERLLEAGGVSAFKRWLMFHSVDNYQKFQGWNCKKKAETASQHYSADLEIPAADTVSTKDTLI